MPAEVRGPGLEARLRQHHAPPIPPLGKVVGNLGDPDPAEIGSDHLEPRPGKNCALPRESSLVRRPSPPPDGPIRTPSTPGSTSMGTGSLPFTRLLRKDSVDTLG